MTPDVGPQTVRGGSPNAGVAMACPLPTDAGTVDTIGCSQGPGNPTMQVCFFVHDLMEKISVYHTVTHVYRG